MQPPPVPFDLMRMFLGDAPPLFLLEILFRTVVIYLYTLALLRWVGGRGIAQLSVVEYLLVIALGSAVGDVLFYPDVPLIHAMLVITVVVLINKGLDLAIVRSDRAKTVLDGGPAQMVDRGRIVQNRLGVSSMGTAELLEMLRSHGVRNLGEVEAAYREASGQLSVFHFDEPRPGLAVVPPPEIVPPVLLGAPRDVKAVCCVKCGNVAVGGDLPDDLACDNCGNGDWTLPSSA